MYKALLIEKDGGPYRASIQQLEDDNLPEGDVTVKVDYSTHQLQGWPGHHRQGAGGAQVSAWWPASTSPAPWKPAAMRRGKPATRWCSTAGAWVKPIGAAWRSGRVSKATGWWRCRPASAHAKAMAIGTAGYTAMLCVMALQGHGLTPDSGDILVTGANGGVGSVAIALLSKLGYRVIAVTGRPQEADALKAWARPRSSRATSCPRPASRWARSAGPAWSIRSAATRWPMPVAPTKYRGAVAACGLAQGMDFPGSVAPFILRGITLFGIDSVMAPQALRQQAWQRLAKDLDLAKLDGMVREIPLADALAAGDDILAGRVRGRLVVNVNA